MKHSMLVILLIMFVTLMMNGCATSPFTENTTDKDIQIEKVNSTKGKIGYVQVSRTKNATLVRGSVLRSTPSRMTSGHVHVDLYNAANTLIDRTIVEYRMRKSGRRVASSANFKTELSTPAPLDAKIVVTHHNGDHFEKSNGTLNIM